MTSPAPRRDRVEPAARATNPRPESRAGSPHQPYTVPYADVLAARLEVELSDDLGRPVPDWVVQVADAHRDPQQPGADSWIVGDVDDPDLRWSRVRRPEPELYSANDYWVERRFRWKLLFSAVLVFALAGVLVVFWLVQGQLSSDSWVPALLPLLFAALAAVYALTLFRSSMRREQIGRDSAARREVEQREYRWRREQALDDLWVPRIPLHRKR